MPVQMGFAARLIGWPRRKRRLGATSAETCRQVARVGTLRYVHYTAQRQRLQSFGVLFGSRRAVLGCAGWQQLRRGGSPGLRLRAGIKFGKHEFQLT